MGIIDYAKSEWKKYLVLAGLDGSITAEIDDSEFDKSTFANCRAVYDAKFDDAFKVKIKNGCGRIVATNERSVLLAVYESLRRLGYAFCFPGKNGEYIPNGLKKEDVCLDFMHYAEYRHRGVALCGPKELYSVLDYIDWMPKVGLNTYFREFWSNHLAWRSWYLREENPYLKKDQSYNLQKGLEYDKTVEKRAKERGLLFHAMGHGWNVALISNDVYEDFRVSPTTVIDYGKVALVNGSRSLPHDIIRCANLCISQAEVREKLLKLVLDYAHDHPDTDVLHVYLGDSLNNVCECENCKKHTLSEWLCLILNEIDDMLTAENNPLRIVFGVYNDTLWPSEKVKLKSDRFILQFCPISRDYARSFCDVNISAKSELPAYELNNVRAPIKTEDFYAFLKAWQRVYGGETIFFDYHGYYASRYDISNLEATSVAVSDIGFYKKAEVNGLISCEFYRNAFPHGFVSYATARALFDGNFDKTAEEKRYFEICFGDLCGKVFEYLGKVNETLPLKVFQWYGETEEIREIYSEPNICVERFIALKELTNIMAQDVKKSENGLKIQKTCIKTFTFYLKTVDAICDLFVMKGKGIEKERLSDRLNRLKETLNKNENYLLPYCPVDHVLQMIFWVISK